MSDHNHDPDDPSGLDRAERLAEVRREHEEQLLSKLFATEEGRFFAWLIIDRSGLGSLSFAETDRGTNFNEGRRSIGILARDTVRLAHPQYLELMEREARFREDFYQARIEGIDRS